MPHENKVVAREETIVIPTYPVPAPDPNPMFLERRVNQGASGKVYPSPFTDQVSNTHKEDKTYQALYLENEYIQLMMLPDLGGHIYIGQDKTNQYDFFYRQHVVKPALIGLIGAWISGGVEWNWPMHHRPSTFMRVQWHIEEGSDGSKTIWCSDHEPMGRTKGMVGLCLYPGKAYVEAKVRLYNRTPYVQTFLWWANVAVHANDQYQVFFPPDVTWVTFHSRADMSYWPVARTKYCGVDYTPGVDISWYKNSPAAASYFAIESNYDFFGGYDHGRQAGLIHLANRHIAPAKKLFTWGTADFGEAWQRNLTDDDGPYIELMAGVYSDNQPDFSWLQPYESKSFSQIWYPIQQIGPAKNANRRVAINLERADGQAKVGVYATEPFGGAVVRLARGERTLLERTLDLAPGAPFVEHVAVPGDVADTELLLTVRTREGQELIRYRPEVRQEKPLPAAATAPAAPKDIASNEELYLTGLHLEQYRHATWDSEPYWQEALRRDPADVRCNNAVGLARFHSGELAEAERHFRAAIARWTARNPNPRDGEPSYNLGLTLKLQGRLDEAYAALYKAIWNYAWQTPGYYALAEIDCLRADWDAALDHLDRSLVTNAAHLKARDLKAAVLRRLGRVAEAEAMVADTIKMDALDFWARNEQALAARARGESAQADKLLGELTRDMTGPMQLYLDIAYDYAAAGLWDEASDLLGRLIGGADPFAASYPMVYYSLGYFAQRRGDVAEALRLYRQGAIMPPDYCFPARLEEMLILEDVLRANPSDGRAAYYLGNLLYDKRRYEEAIAQWEAATRIEPGFAIPWRNLGFATYNVRRDPQRARECYRKAFAASPNDPRLLFELDQLQKRLVVPPAERLATLEQRPDLLARRADLTVERAALYCQLGQPQKALDLIMAQRFAPWEGGEGRVSGPYCAAHLMLGQQALQAGKAQEAAAHFEALLHYPESLGEGRRTLGPEPQAMVLLGLAREALGDAEGARACWRQVGGAGDEWGYSLATYYRALALGKLGDDAGRRSALHGLLEHAIQGLKAGPQPVYFGTSQANTLLFHDDLDALHRIEMTYLLALARLGLGQLAEAKQALEQVLTLDPNHLLAREELKRL